MCGARDEAEDDDAEGWEGVSDAGWRLGASGREEEVEELKGAAEARIVADETEPSMLWSDEW